MTPNYIKFGQWYNLAIMNTKGAIAMNSSVRNEKGEGLVKMLLLLALLIGGGYFALQYFGVIGDKSSAANTAQASPTPAAQGGNGAGGSLAAQQVQGAAAMGELAGGR
jgi:Flp pilus assembly protein TadG